MLEKADTSEVIDLNTLALPLYSVIYWASAPRTFSFADPTVFTRTVSGNWTDTTGWTPAPGCRTATP